MADSTSSSGRLGGTDGNERLTGSTASVLLILLTIEGLTVLSLHVFTGVLLIPPVLLKAASTGYRFIRYYGGDAPYVRKGPPALLLRALGPVIVISSAVLLATGVALLVMGPGDGGVRGIHKLSFIVLFAAMSAYVLAHLREVPALTAADWRRGSRLAGASIPQWAACERRPIPRAGRGPCGVASPQRCSLSSSSRTRS